MAQEQIREIVRRMIQDKTFRESFLKGPDQALAANHLKVNADELAALKKLTEKDITALAQHQREVQSIIHVSDII